MKNQLLTLKKSIIMFTLSVTTASSFVDTDGIDHLQRLLMVGEITEEEYDKYNQQRMYEAGLISESDNEYYNELWNIGIDPFLRLRMVGEDSNYDYELKYIK